MLVILAIVLFIVAIGGGLLVHPLLFLIAVLAILAFAGGYHGRW